MSPISSTSQSNSVPIPEASSASIRNTSTEEAIKNLRSVLTSLSLNKFHFDLLSKTSVANITSFRPPNSPIDIVNIINLVKRLGEETPGNYGFFKIENGEAVFCPRFEAYLNLNPQMSIYEYLKEACALKQAGKSEEKKAAFSLEQLEKLTAKDFSSLGKEHKRSTEISCITNTDTLYGKKLSTTGESPLFPLEIFQIFAKSRDIQSLSLNSKIIHLPGNISRLNKLKDLDLSNNKLESLPRVLANLPKLARLDLSRNSLSSLPTLTRFKGIGVLNLSHNKFSSLPEDFYKLYNLSDLDLSHNLFESVPNEVGLLTKLRNLDVSFNEITSLPKKGIFYSKLTNLNLSNNGLKSLPSHLNKFCRLKELDLSSNKLTCLGEETNFLNSVEILNLNDNNLTSLPKAFKEFLYLKALFLRGNEISSVENIPVNSSFSFCDLRNNQLTSLTNEFLENSRLESLYLTGNKDLTSVPEKIKNLKHLNELRVSQWQKVPESLSCEAHASNLLIQYEDCKEKRK